jgi:NodT family efflux transporter outer membrane factor (OMF) lipoprotein
MSAVPRLVISLLAAILTMVGCQIGEAYTPEVAADQLPIARSFGTGSKQKIQDGWIASFGDENLVALVVEALKNNPDLQASAARVEAAAGHARKAGALLSPTVSLGAGGYRTGNTGGEGASVGGASLDMTWEVDVWGRLASGTRAATYQFMATELAFEYGRQSLAAQVAKSWFLCVETHLQLDLANQAVAIYENTLKITTAQLEAGAVAKDTVHLSKADLASAKEAQRDATGANASSVRALEVLLGRYPSAELKVTKEFVAVPAAIPVGLPSEMLERRADLLAAERRVAASFELLNVAKAARLPRVAMTASAGGSTSNFQALGNPGNAFWNAGANLLAPLFDGGYLKSEQEIASAEQKGAVAEFRSAALRAFADVENSLTNDQLLKERETFLAEALKQNTAAWTLAKTKFAAGEIDLLSVLQMQKRVIQARVALTNIHNRRLTQRVNLHLGLGGNFEIEPKPEKKQP